MTHNTVLKVDGLSKKFYIGTKEKTTLFSSLRQKIAGEYPLRELWALKNIHFSVNKGEMVGVIGPNGAGKTTLLRVLSGIIVPTEGMYTVYDKISCIFELGVSFNPKFTAIDNVYLYGALHGLSRREMDKKLPAIIEFSGLDSFMEAKLSEFSSGMRSRLAFATMIQIIHGLIMIDEVLSVGDAAFQKKCIKAIERLLQEGNTIFFVSHSLDSMRHICSKALYLNRGMQVQYGDFEEVSAQYAMSFENNTL